VVTGVPKTPNIDISVPLRFPGPEARLHYINIVSPVQYKTTTVTKKSIDRWNGLSENLVIRTEGAGQTIHRFLLSITNGLVHVEPSRSTSVQTQRLLY